MTRDQKIQSDTLLQLYAVRALPNPHLTAALLHREARTVGLDYTAAEFAAALRYLCDRGLAHHQRDATTGADTYRLTADGVDEYNRRFSP